MLVTTLASIAFAASGHELPKSPLAAPATKSSERTTCASRDLKLAYSKAYYKVRNLGGASPGRNIRKYGLSRSRKATCADLSESRATLLSMSAPAPQLAEQATGSMPSVPSAGAPPSYIAECESGGDPTKVSADGVHRGKWQFDQQTWESVGGTGDPAAASEAEQDARAGTLYAQRGPQPWECA